MKEKSMVNEDLKILWEIRDQAITRKDRIKAQERIDEYFLGKPEKKIRKKDKKTYIPEDEWEY